MPRMIPPSLVRLFQLTLSQLHSDKFMQHFGYAKLENILHTPIQVLAERKGVAVSAATATDFQINLFMEDTRMAIDSTTSFMGQHEVTDFVRQAR
eukprot:4919555-Lingulodinium_polyedra.AAC.1